MKTSKMSFDIYEVGHSMKKGKEGLQIYRRSLLRPKIWQCETAVKFVKAYMQQTNITFDKQGKLQSHSSIVKRANSLNTLLNCWVHNQMWATLLLINIVSTSIKASQIILNISEALHGRPMLKKIRHPRLTHLSPQSAAATDLVVCLFRSVWKA